MVRVSPPWSPSVPSNGSAVLTPPRLFWPATFIEPKMFAAAATVVAVYGRACAAATWAPAVTLPETMVWAKVTVAAVPPRPAGSASLWTAPPAAARPAAPPAAPVPGGAVVAEPPPAPAADPAGAAGVGRRAAARATQRVAAGSAAARGGGAAGAAEAAAPAAAGAGRGGAAVAA